MPVSASPFGASLQKNPGYAPESIEKWVEVGRSKCQTVYVKPKG